MKLLKDFLFARTRLGIFFLAMLVWSCTPLVSSVEDSGLMVVNRASKPLVYSVIESRTYDHIDLKWKFQITSDQENQLQPDESISVFEEDVTVLNEYKPIEDLTINLWEVVQDSAFHNRTIMFTQEELEQRDFRIEIEEGADGFFVAGADKE